MLFSLVFALFSVQPFQVFSYRQSIKYTNQIVALSKAEELSDYKSQLVELFYRLNIEYF